MGRGVRTILVLQGPNLNLLGTRQPEVYGTTTLSALQADLDKVATELDVRLVHVQSNVEGKLVQQIQEASNAGFVGALINAGGYTHTSVAIRDALLATSLPFVEVHISCVLARETFRHTSLMSDLASGVVMGFGVAGYELGLRGLIQALNSPV